MRCNSIIKSDIIKNIFIKIFIQWIARFVFLCFGIKDEEYNALKKYTPEMAIIVAFNPKDKSPDGKIEVLQNGAHLIDTGLLDIAKNIGIKKILIDTAAMAPGDNSGA